MGLLKCRVRGVFMTLNEIGAAPTVLLDAGEHGAIPIYIGLWEAISISTALRGEIMPRPFTHDLMVDVMANFGISLESISIDSLEGNVFYARLLLHRNGKEESLDCRPSDGIALALRTQVPIEVDCSVVREAAVQKEDLPEMVDIVGYL